MPQSILTELSNRGLLQDVSDRDGLAALLNDQMVPVYAGYDPTATSLHVGNLIPTILLARLQKAGHQPIALVGGATGMIGDPSGRSDERNLLGLDEIAENSRRIRSQLESFLDFSATSNPAIMLNNADWLAPLSFLEFLRDVGKHLTVNYMVAKESVRSRLDNREQGITYTEFSYMLLQAFDFCRLAKTHNCLLQVGGSDQWGNITAGIELARKTGGLPRLFGLTAPLLLDAQGNKMGKTASGNRVWLDPTLTSPYAFYQYWLNTADADLERLLRIFSWQSVHEISELCRAHNEAPHERLGQKALAADITSWVHGADQLRRAVAASQVMFGGSLEDLCDDDLAPLLNDIPCSTISRAELDSGLELVELLARAGLAKSKGAARRLLEGGGVYLNNQRVTDLGKTVYRNDLGTETMLILRSGKRNYHIVMAK